LNGDVELESLSPVLCRGSSFQTNLNELDGILTPSSSYFIILRQEESLTFITYVPYRAKEDERTSILEYRHECARRLGEEHFTASIICKEIGEITDVRSWEERDAEMRSQIAKSKSVSSCDTSEYVEHEHGGMQEMGYKKSKCRLCDRRMKNKISTEALDAFTKLHTHGTAVQIVLLPCFGLSWCSR
jgi:twinfilin-like protein